MTRWGGGLPQYAVGHLERVARIQAARRARFLGWRSAARRTTASASRRVHRVGSGGGHPGDSTTVALRRRQWAHDRRPDPRRHRQAPAPGQGRAQELNEVIRYTMWSVFQLRDRCDRGGPRGHTDEVEALFAQLGAKDVVVRGTVRRLGSACRRRPDDLVARVDADALQEAYNLFRRTALGGALVPVWSHWRCTAPPSSTRATSRRSSPTSRRATTSASTRSCGPTSGTCSRTRSAARCSPSTARWRAATPTCAPTPSRRSPWATTSGFSPSRPTSCTGSST